MFSVTQKQAEIIRYYESDIFVGRSTISNKQSRILLAESLFKPITKACCKCASTTYWHSLVCGLIPGFIHVVALYPPTPCPHYGSLLADAWKSLWHSKIEQHGVLYAKDLYLTILCVSCQECKVLIEIKFEVIKRQTFDTVTC